MKVGFFIGFGFLFILSIHDIVLRALLVLIRLLFEDLVLIIFKVVCLSHAIFSGMAIPHGTKLNYINKN